MLTVGIIYPVYKFQSHLKLLFQRYTITYFNSPVSIWQGFTSEDQTTLSVLFPKDQQLFYFLKDSRGEHEIYPISEFHKPYSQWKVEHLLITELKTDPVYTLVVKNKNSKIISKKIFKTLDLNQRSFTIAVASCMDDYWSKKTQKQMWKNLLSFRPDMVFLIGDNIYADKNISKPSMPNFYRRYVEAFNTLYLYKANRLVPILAVWDDHDYGFNNGHKNFQYKSEMQELFRGFFPLNVNNKHLIKGKGVSFLLQTGYQNFFFMDDQSFRSPPDPQGRLWGKAQEQWLFQHILNTQNPSWIINGGQLFGRHHTYESFERDFPENFKFILQRLEQSPSSVFFLSGDRHLAELLKIDEWPYTTYELTTSAIHAKVHPQRGDHDLDVRHVHHVTEKHNFAIIKSQGQSKNLILDISVNGPQKSILFSEKLHIYKK